jgi:hypothetical protein
MGGNKNTRKLHGVQKKKENINKVNLRRLRASRGI